MKIHANCRVTMKYALRLEDGEEVESSSLDEPLEFVTGRDEVIPCLEKGIMGMESGELRSFAVGPEDAFGLRDPEAVRVVNRAELEDHGDELEEGMIFRIRDEDGNTMVITVASLDEEEVVFDLNHPLAGAPLRFEVEILEVNQLPLN